METRQKERPVDPTTVHAVVKLTQRQREERALEALEAEEGLSARRLEAEKQLEGLVRTVASLKAAAHPASGLSKAQRRRLALQAVQAEARLEAARQEARRRLARAEEEVAALQRAARTGRETREFSVESEVDYRRGVKRLFRMEGRRRVLVAQRALTEDEANQELFSTPTAAPGP